MHFLHGDIFEAEGAAAPVTIRADKSCTVYVVDGADLNEHYRQSQAAERMGRDYMAYRLEQVKSRILARYKQKGGIEVTVFNIYYG